MARSIQNNDANETLKVLERWGQRATVVILAGIVVELAALWFVARDLVEWIWLAAANALIGAGLIVHYIAIGRVVIASTAARTESDERVAEADRLARAAEAEGVKANARTAEANARAAEAQAELERLRAPLPFDAAAFARDLNGKSSWPVKEILYVDSQDCLALAGRIAEALNEAKWPVGTVPRPLRGINPNFMLPPEVLEALPRTATYGGQHYGVSVVAKRPVDEQSPQNALISAIAKALPSQKVSGGRDPWMADAILRIVVAPRA